MPDGGVIGALAAANSWGSVTMPGSNAFWSWPFEIGGEFGGARPASDYQPQPLAWGAAKTEAEPRANTTIAIIASDYRLNKAEAKRLAIMAQDGLARAIRPAHAPFDGDVVFAVATGARDLAEPRQSSLARVGAAAGDVLARAIARGVYEAAAWDGECVWRDLRPDGSRQP
jgi:L-aminopeptidase/D-esterase-like protein